MALQFFRYVFIGCGNVLLDWTAYFITYNFILNKEVVDLGFVVMSPHIAALVFTFPFLLLWGFYLSRNVTFTESSLRGRVQLFRYIMIVAINLLINYVSLKLFVDEIGLWPLPSKMITTVFTTIFSYFAQKHYSFKQHQE